MKKLAVPLFALMALTCGRSGVYRYESFSMLPDGAVMMDEDAGTDAGVIPCVPGHIQLIKATPVVLLVLDRSSSMGFRFEQSTRWRALTEGLATALPPVDLQMEIGSLAYPMGAGGLACVPPAALDFPPSKGNVTPIIGKMRTITPSGSTPTAAALDVAGPALLGARAPASGRALILATDGAPGCNGALDPRTCVCINNQGTGGTGRCEANRCLDDVRTVARIAHFADAGLPTYVVGIQSEADMTLTRVLNDMAVAGGRPQADAGTRFYAVSSGDQLDSALATIRDQVGACSFLARSVPDRDEAMTVMLPGFGVIPFDPSGKAGWAWGQKSAGELFIAGSACDEVTARMHAVLEAEVACDEP